jgi:hypothetical protein
MGRPGVWAEPGYVQHLHDIAGGARPPLNLQVSG